MGIRETLKVRLMNIILHTDEAYTKKELRDMELKELAKIYKRHYGKDDIYKMVDTVLHSKGM